MSCGCGQQVSGRSFSGSRVLPMAVAGADAVNRGIQSAGGQGLWWLPMAALVGVGILIAMGGRRKRRRRK